MGADSAEHMRTVAEAAGFGGEGPGSAFLDSLQPEQLNLLVAAVAGKMLGAAPADTTTDTAGTGTTGGDASMTTPSREQMVQDLVTAGQDQAALEQMDDAALTELWQQLKGGGGSTAAAPSTYGERGRHARGPQRVQVIQLSPSTLRQLVRAEARAEGARAARPDTRRRISEFCEQAVRDGYLSPAQVEVDAQGKTIGPVRKRLERASTLSRFGEGEKSELELQMEEIRSGNVVRSYGERLADGPGGAVGGNGGADSAFEAKVKAHYDAREARAKRA